MKKEINLTVKPKHINDYKHIKKRAAQVSGRNIAEINAVKILRRSIDARSKQPVFRLHALVYINEKPVSETPEFEFKNVEKSKQVIIVGSGPAGMFAALKLLELGLKPVIVERGKDVQTRRRDIRILLQDHVVNSNSNYCFGEGGAGTYSDGKLYTRSTKRGDVKRILNLLHYHGAVEDILIDAHPHIGSNKLPNVVKNIRETILKYGGEYHFDSRVTGFVINEKKIRGVVVNDSKEIIGEAVILATGHSARDIYYLLGKENVKLESKPFAMGVRIEHPQQLIDQIQYHTITRPENLPASSYNLSCQVDDRGVYSFCMCPGGIIVPASTEPGELVLNGMSISRRDSPFANSGIVVSITDEDLTEYKSHGVFAGLEFQKYVERLAWEAGGKTQCAPAQRITDFVNNKISQSLPKSSYIPGTVSSPLHNVLPRNMVIRLCESLKVFNRKMKGYFTDEAQILAAETRTSSPIRIPRDKETFMHVEIEGLFPVGEGAGYAGGIVSAAIDGECCAEQVDANITK